MRIIGGKYKGLKLLPPDDNKIRPTSDRLKESLFSIISSNKYKIKIDSSNVLDICSGTGSLGIEAFSRGARSVTFIDKDYLPYVIIFHIVGTCIGVGMHNHGHRIFHQHDTLPYCMQVPYPEIYRKFIHEHHTYHHMNAKQNYCTIFLGFDYLIGTSHY